MNKQNLCPTCKYGSPQDNSGLGLVNCICHKGRACGNAYQKECESYRENARIARLKSAAVEAINDFNKLYAIPVDGNEAHAAEMAKAAARSCHMQEAYAIILDIGYDLAAEILHDAARGQNEQGTENAYIHIDPADIKLPSSHDIAAK